MDFLNGMYLMVDCASQAMVNVSSIIGYVIWGIKVAVPIILIVVGMIELGTAVAQKGEDEVKKAQKSLIKKAIMGVVIFLIPTLVQLIMQVLSSDDWKGCMTCINHPNNAEFSPKADKDDENAVDTCEINTKVE